VIISACRSRGSCLQQLLCVEKWRCIFGTYCRFLMFACPQKGNIPVLRKRNTIHRYADLGCDIVYVAITQWRNRIRDCVPQYRSFSSASLLLHGYLHLFGLVQNLVTVPELYFLILLNNFQIKMFMI